MSLAVLHGSPSSCHPRWTIKVRVSSKSQIRTYVNARGTGKLFSCDLVDQSGEIRATAFNDDCDRFYPLLDVGEVGRLDPAMPVTRTASLARCTSSLGRRSS